MNDPDPSSPVPAAPDPELAAPDDGPRHADLPEADRPEADRSEAERSEAAGSPAAGSPAEASTAEPALPDPVPHAGARYAALRLLMLVAAAGILYVVGFRGWLLAFTAVLVSGIVSLFLLMKQRNDAAVNLERQVDGWKHRNDHGDSGLAQE